MSRTATYRSEHSWRREPFWLSPTGVTLGALAYCLLFFVLRNVLSPVLAVDDAEQIAVVQRLDWGYRLSQPPFHSWVLWLVMQVAGPTLLALTIVKYAFLCLTILCVWGAAREVTERRDSAVLAAVSLALIYLIGYKVHVGYAHTMAVMAMASVTVWAFLRLRRVRTLGAYGLFGLALGLGLVAKYNMPATALALPLAALCVPSWRPVVLDRRFVVSLALMAAVSAPHFHWALTGTGGAFEAYVEARMTDEGGTFWSLRVVPALETVAAYAEFLVPFLPLVLLAFPVMLRGAAWRVAMADGTVRMLGLHLAFAFLILMTASVIGGAADFKGRHMHPFLISAPVFVFAALERIGTASLRPPWRRFTGRRVWFVLAFVVIGVTAAAVTIRALTPPPDCGRCRLARPYVALGDHIRDDLGIGRGTLIAGDEFIAGNVRARVWDMRVHTTTYVVDPGAVPPPLDRPHEACLVVWDAEEGDAVPDDLRALAADVRGYDDLDAGQATTVEFPYRLNPDVTRSFHILRPEPAGDCG